MPSSPCTLSLHWKGGLEDAGSGTVPVELTGPGDIVCALRECRHRLDGAGGFSLGHGKRLHTLFVEC